MAKAVAFQKDWERDGKEKVKKAQQTLHVTMVIDRSGSMASVRSDVIGGFNELLKEQQNQDGECRLTVNQFDSVGFDTLFEAMDVKEVRDATDEDFSPRGWTPLFDAIGRTITQAQIRSESPDGKDEKVLIVILTDGFENASIEYNQSQIKALIAAKESQGWIFTYLGANHDSYLQAGQMGFARASTQNYAGDSYGTRAVMSNVSAAVSSTRTRMKGGMSVNSSNFYAETGKTAEEDLQSRVGQSTAQSENDSPSRGWSKK